MRLMNRSRGWCLGALLMLPGLTLVAAQLGSRTAEEWQGILEREQRVSGLKIEEVVARLGLEPGDQVADIGAGTGVFSGPLARAVAPGGTLYAVEIDQELLDYITDRADRENLTNITTVLAEFEDPKLPRRDVDVAFFHDVIHHIEKRQEYFLATAAYMAPASRIVVVDYHGGHPRAPHGDQPELQTTLREVTELMAVAGFDLTQEFELFDEKFFVVFTKRD